MDLTLSKKIQKTQDLYPDHALRGCPRCRRFFLIKRKGNRKSRKVTCPYCEQRLLAKNDALWCVPISSTGQIVHFKELEGPVNELLD